LEDWHVDLFNAAFVVWVAGHTGDGGVVLLGDCVILFVGVLVGTNGTICTN